MAKTNEQINKNPQDIQDDIFKKMSADKKIECGSQLWKLAKSLVGDKINYGRNRPAPSFGGNR
jgi:hypothetical protein